MKIPLPKLKMHHAVFLLILWSTFATAQVTASLSNQVSDTGMRKAYKPLKDFLTELEKTFDVHFSFESAVVRDRFLEEDVKLKGDLEEILNKILAPLNLGFVKVADKYYSIYDKKASGSMLIPPGSALGTAISKDAPSITVAGIVTDETDFGLPGVNIVEKGTTNGTVTDKDGRFQIVVSDENAVLVVSFLGYLSVEEPVGNRTEINVQLEPDVQTLSEIVVVGYSTQDRKEITAAVNTIDVEQMESRPVTNMLQALQGLAPNLTIQQNVAEPGSVQTINIRGVGSFTDNSPLIIVDDINVGALGLNYLNPNDVESITVLKDAASSAIYGSQAANGVIYIKTKKGKKEEKASVEYNGLMGLQSPTTTPTPIEGWEFMTLKNEALVNSGLPPQFMPSQIKNSLDSGSHPWAYDELVNNSVPQQNHNLSITGGSNKTSYLLSAGILNQESLLNNSYVPDDKHFYYKRHNFRSNISTEVNKYLRAEVSIAYTNSVNRTHPFSTGLLMRDAMRTPRIYPIKDKDGNFVVPPLTSNSVFSLLSEGGFKLMESNNLLGGLNLTITPIENLVVNVNGSGNYSIYNEESQIREFTYAPQYSTAAPPPMDEQRKANWNDFTKIFFATAEYERTFSRHTGKMLVGYRSDYLQNYSLVSAYRVNGTRLDDRYMIAGNFNIDQDGEIIGNIGDYNNIVNPELKVINSVFGRMNYSFDDKYLAEFTWRYDGASVLAPENRWFFFPAVSLGWRLTDETFLTSFRNSVGDIKLRYSIGQVGNSNIGGFNYLSRISYLQGLYSFNNTPVQGVHFSSVNPELEWERSTMANYGLDANLFKNRVVVSFDYFNKDTKGIYFTPAVPGALGLGSPIQNFAEVRSVGWEASLAWSPQTGSLKHNIGFNIADNTNKVIKVGQEQIMGTDFSYIIKEGFPLSSYYLYKSDGLYQNMDDLESAPSVPFAFNQKVNPGDVRYVDKDGNGVIDGDDRYILGNPFPRFTFGINYNAVWKNFDFQMLWQGVGKRSQYLRGDIVEAFHNNEEHAFVQHKDRWTPTNPDASYPRLTASTSTNANNTAYSDYWLFDTKYLRLKNLQIGYSLPTAWVTRVGMQKFRIYFSSQNLLTFSKKRFAELGIDPEFTQFDNSLDFTNYDPIAGRNYPNAKVVALGVDIKF